MYLQGYDNWLTREPELADWDDLPADDEEEFRELYVESDGDWFYVVDPDGACVEGHVYESYDDAEAACCRLRKW